jgi:hypothetical protein
MDESSSPDESTCQILLLPRRRVRGPALTGDMAGAVRERWRLVWQPGTRAGFPPRREATPGMGTDRAPCAAHGEGRERAPGARAPTGASAAARGARALTQRTRWRGGDGDPSGVRRWMRMRDLVREPADAAWRHGAAESPAPTEERSGAARCPSSPPRAVRLRVRQYRLLNHCQNCR